MHLNLNDPDSIVRWWRVYPERHWCYLEFYETHSPQYQAAIRQARRRIQADPRFDRQRIDALHFQAREASRTETLDEVWASKCDALSGVAEPVLN